MSEKSKEFTTRVALGDKTYTLDWAKAHPDKLQPRLKGLYQGDTHPRCLCTAQGVDLVIRDRGGLFHLARWPNTGPQHDPRCAFYELDRSLSGAKAYTVEAIRETPDGTVRVGLDARLIRRRQEEESAPSSADAGSTQRNTVTLLGLLHELWTRAKLNVWHPSMVGKRGWWVVRHRILEVAAEVHVNGQALADILWIPEPFRRDQADAQRAARNAFLGRFLPAGDETRHYHLALGELRKAEIVESTGSQRIHLRQEGDDAEQFVAAGLWAATERRFGEILNAWRAAPAENPVIAIMICEAREKARNGALYGDVQALALMRITPEFIPVESGYEVAMARHLVESGRRFAKPLRYDADESAVFPDFILTDMGTERWVIEVWGRAGEPEYDAHRRIKESWYRANGFKCLGWTPEEENIPRLP